MVVDCGTQVRLPGNRRTVGPGVAKTETFRQKMVERFDSSYRAKAREHSIGRNRAVGHVLAIFSFLKTDGAIPAGARVDWDRAHVQSIKGDVHSDAAHNLPCQIVINGQLPWNMSFGKDLAAKHLVAELRSLFGGTMVAPKVFNAADSISEKNCLRGGFTAACAHVLDMSKPAAPGPGVLKRGVGLNYGEIELTRNDTSSLARIDVDVVVNAFQMWITLSRAAFEKAIAEVRAEGATSMGVDVTEDVLYILDRYNSEAMTATAPTRDFLGRMEQEFWRATSSPQL